MRCAPATLAVRRRRRHATGNSPAATTPAAAMAASSSGIGMAVLALSRLPHPDFRIPTSASPMARWFARDRRGAARAEATRSAHRSRRLVIKLCETGDLAVRDSIHNYSQKKHRKILQPSQKYAESSKYHASPMV